MADQQRIHPVPHGHDDVEAATPPHQASPTAPLVPHGANKSSEMGNPPSETTAYPPPLRRTYPPAMHSKPPNRRRGCLCRCFCWTLSLILILLITLAIIAGILFLVFRPKLPKYSVDSLRITRFNVSGDNSSLQASFNVTITARNPNKRIGIYYEGGSRINVWFRETKLCEGSLPKFYQGHRNTTVLVVPLTGQTENAAGLVREVSEQRQETGNVPLRLRVKQPVRVKLGKLKLMKVNFRVRCLLLVDDLSANAVNIRSSSCKFRFRL